MTDIVLYLFHRDLRVEDNLTLEFIHKQFPDSKVLPVFIFTPLQVSDKAPIKSLNSIQFMISSLMELNTVLRSKKSRVFCFYGDNLDIINTLFTHIPFKALIETKDYTPFAKEREKMFRLWCSYKAISYHCVEDMYLTNPGTLRTGSGKVFQKFTPFYNTAKRISVAHPKPTGNLVKWFSRTTGFPGEVTLVDMRKKLIPKENPFTHVKGGRTEALRLLKTLPVNYDKERDIPSKRTSNLSAHNHFGTVSIREVYHAGKRLHLEEFVRQLYWRDFYGHIMAEFEKLYGISALEFQKDSAGTGWKYDNDLFNKWCRGETGHALVDAGMRQLNQTGYIHNRARLVCAYYLVKDLKIFWRWGERYFASKLVDYDITQNMMNWIWCASVLPFASAPFRKLNPEIQAKKFDPDEEYQKKWLSN